MHILRQEERGTGMAEIMKANPTQPVFLLYLLEPSTHIAFIKKRTCRRREHITKIDPFVAGSPSAAPRFGLGSSSRAFVGYLRRANSLAIVTEIVVLPAPPLPATAIRICLPLDPNLLRSAS
jgi:hypothetical protein